MNEVVKIGICFLAGALAAVVKNVVFDGTKAK